MSASTPIAMQIDGEIATVAVDRPGVLKGMRSLMIAVGLPSTHLRRTMGSFFVLLVMLLAACSSSKEAVSPTSSTTSVSSEATVESTEVVVESAGTIEEFPDVVAATARRDVEDTVTIDATLSSPYDSAERYADAWRVLGPDGSVLGIRELSHDHAAEQPFTRSLSGIVVPDDVDWVTIEGRDLLSGWGGMTFVLDIPPKNRS